MPEPLSVMQGAPLNLKIPGYEVRPAKETELSACNVLCWRVHGVDRGAELADAIAQGTAMVIEQSDQITGYATEIGYFAHAVGESNGDLKALIGAAPAFSGPGFLLPTRNGDVLRWCLGQGLRHLKQQTLMTIGLYNEPTSAYLPSILY